MKIRTENNQDYAEIRQLLKMAFATVKHSDGKEYELVEKLRLDKAFIPELALVAEMQGNIVGYALVAEMQGNIVGYALSTTVHIGCYQGLALAPLAVHPDYQRQGIGGSLIRASHQIGKTRGFQYYFVLGEPYYYSQFGYQTASQFGIQSPFDVPDEFFMLTKLTPHADNIAGIVHYADAFAIKPTSD